VGSGRERNPGHRHSRLPALNTDVESLLKIYRPNLGRKIPLTLAAIVFVLACVGAVVQSGGTFFSYVWRVALPTVSVIVIFVLLRVARPRIELRAEGILVVNIFQRRRLDWQQIVAVRFAKDAPWASLDLADGTKLNVMAIQNSDGLKARAIAQEIANRSNE
jgi:hypothetical protein